MKALFVESDPVMRGLVHCLATMAGLDHAVVATGREALRLLRGLDPVSGESWTCSTAGAGVGVVIADTDLPDLDGADLAALIRRLKSGIPVFGHAHLDGNVRPGSFDRVFWKPDAEEAVRAAIEAVGADEQGILFRTMIPSAA